MKIFITLICLSIFIYADDTEDYLGSTYVLAIAAEESCVQLNGTTDVINEHFGVIAKIRFCDEYTNANQEYLKQSYFIGGGMSYYLNSIYRDSLYASASVDIGQSYIQGIIDNENGSATYLAGNIEVGYQWHFKRGTVVSIAVHYSKQKAVGALDANIKNILNEDVKTSDMFHPTLSLGWRF